jgi:NTP pyrophosphatase (non-canonical NTP hydrolase)
METIREIQDSVHALAFEKGWWDSPRSIGECLMLVNCELAEAMEEYRVHGTGKPVYKVNDKPEGFAVEIADAIIRLLDLAGYYGLDIQSAIQEKHKYNMTRPYRHGNKNA